MFTGPPRTPPVRLPRLLLLLHQLRSQPCAVLAATPHSCELRTAQAVTSTVLVVLLLGCLDLLLSRAVCASLHTPLLSCTVAACPGCQQLPSPCGAASTASPLSTQHSSSLSPTLLGTTPSTGPLVLTAWGRCTPGALWAMLQEPLTDGKRTCPAELREAPSGRRGHCTPQGQHGALPGGRASY